MNEVSQAVVPYDPTWSDKFTTLKERVFPVIQELITGFEHVGSTAVKGLAAKPVIDIDAIYRNQDFLPEIIKRLKRLGYAYDRVTLD